jgi:3-dehydroquinate synthase
MVADTNDFDATSVPVQLGERSYQIEIASNATEQFASTVLDALGDMSHALFVLDEAVADQWGNSLIDELQSSKIRVDSHLVPSGEPSKSIKQFESLLEWMLSTDADRRSVVIAVGGGVVGDLAGFAAAAFTRGIRFVQVPTTLLAMVDSSVGGKTGINLPTAKNMVGAFWQPSLVWIDTDVLSTLPDRDYISGLAEVIKYGVIDDAPFFDWLESNWQSLVKRESAAVREAIARSCQSKANVVGADERETSGRRAILNYGHTFAHAIEATAGYGTLTHGEAVSIGMQMAANLAISLGMCDAGLLERQTALLQNVGLPTRFSDANTDQMLPVMQRDKKVAHGKLRFILPVKIGVVELVGDIPESAVIDAIQACV